MPNRFANFDLGTGDNDGSTAANAWQTLQDVIDGSNDTQPQPGEKVYCIGTDTLSSPVDMDGQSGDTTSGPVIFVGCSDLTPTIDGTRAEIDANGQANILTAFSMSNIIFENFNFHNCTGDGIVFGAGSDRAWFVNCLLHNCGANGVAGNSGAIQNWWIRSKIYNCTNDGFTDMGTGFVLALCAVYNNGDQGTDPTFSGDHLYYGNAIFDNGDGDRNLETSAGCYTLCNVIDGTNQGTETGLYVTYDYNLVLFNRITNLATGLDASSEAVWYGWNLFESNTADTANMTLAVPIPQDADLDTNEIDPDAGDDGYEDASAMKYNLKESMKYNGDGNDVIGMNVP